MKLAVSSLILTPALSSLNLDFKDLDSIASAIAYATGHSGDKVIDPGQIDVVIRCKCSSLEIIYVGPALDAILDQYVGFAGVIVGGGWDDGRVTFGAIRQNEVTAV